MPAATATKPDPDIRKKLGAISPTEAVNWLNLLVYGDPGAGKTHLAGTAEDAVETAPVLFLDVEGGVTTLRRRKGLDVVPVRSIDEIVKIHATLYGSDNCGGYRTVVIDSLTELQKVDMRGIMKELVSRRPDLEEDVPSQREWGISRERMVRIVRAYRDLPMNTIMTATAAEDRDSNNISKFGPMLPGKQKADIPAFMDIVGYLTTDVEEGETVRQLQTLGTRRVMAKDRTAALGDLVKNPTIPSMWKLINESN